MAFLRSTVAAATLAAAVIVGLPGAAAGVPERAPAGAGPAVAADEKSAIRQAAATGSRVEIASDRTPISQVFAEPTGNLTFEASAVPKRVLRADGTWADIDLALAAGSDQVVRPAVSPVDVRFSGGGSGPLVTMADGGKTFTVGWPLGTLPPPVLIGDTAVYTEVLPGVDLAVRATLEGFSHVLKVKTAAAASVVAQNPVTFDLGGDANVTRDDDGTLRATAGDRLIAEAPAPVMWDSRRTKALAGPSGGPAEDGASGTSDTSGPGDAARTAAVGAAVNSAGDLVLQPDQGLLTDGVFPVYIDPAWSKGRSRWAYATSNNSTNTDLDVARVGRDPESSKTYRSFFEFAVSGLKGRHIEWAYVKMKLDHSWACDDRATTMYKAATVTGTPRTSWSTSLIRQVSSATSHANEGSGCYDAPQPDMPVNFEGSGVTSMVQAAADSGASSVTVGFKAPDESNHQQWKKFFPGDAKLVADIDAKPGKPTGLQVNGVACTSSGISIGIGNPYFSARLPDADSSQSIKATWEWAEVSASGAVTTLTPPAATTTPANTVTQSARVSVANTQNVRTFRFRVRGTDPSPYSISGSWSDWCTFTIDRDAPRVDAEVTVAPAGPGKPGTFRITSPHTDVVKFRYGWTETTNREVTATSVYDPATAQTIRAATVTAIPPKYGVNVLYLKAIDATGNLGYGSRDFTAARPSPAVARWGLMTMPGVDQTAALADQSPLNGTTDLSGGQLSWVEQGRIIGAQHPYFTAAALPGTAAGVVNTTQSFSVGAFTRVTDSTRAQTALSQDGTRAAAFSLSVRNQRWCFVTRDSDTDGAADGVSACSADPVKQGLWVHVAGGYDAVDKKLRLWVDGKLKAEVSAGTVWSATGPFRVGGRRSSSTAFTDTLAGSLADVQVFDRVLVTHDFTGMAADDEGSGGVDEPGILRPIEVGRWDFDAATSCRNPAIPNTCQALDGAAWSRRLSFTQGTDVRAGGNGRAVVFDNVFDFGDDTDPRYGMFTDERGIAQRRSSDGVSWYTNPVLRTDQSFTVSVWVQPSKFPAWSSAAVAQYGTRLSAFQLGIRRSTPNGVETFRWEMSTMDSDADGAAYVGAAAPKPLTADVVGEWTHLVGVYDREAGQIRLHVNGDEVAVVAHAGLFHANSGLSVGRGWWAAAGATPSWVDPWFGGLDDLQIYHGAMTKGQIARLYEQQASPFE